MMQGMLERVRKEMGTNFGEGYTVNVSASDSRKHQSWLGASIMSSLGSFCDMMITKSEFEDDGPRIVHRKCF